MVFGIVFGYRIIILFVRESLKLVLELDLIVRFAEIMRRRKDVGVIENL